MAAADSKGRRLEIQMLARGAGPEDVRHECRLQSYKALAGNQAEGSHRQGAEGRRRNACLDIERQQ
eukprot:14652425-Alexandrium_andersonii.AAC.1